MACPVTVSIPVWAAISVLLLLFWHDRAWRAVWWLWLGLQIAGWWGRAAMAPDAPAARYILEGIFLAGAGVAAARVWFLLTIERRDLPGSRAFRRLAAKLDYDILRDPVAALFKGALLGLFTRELFGRGEVERILYAAVSLALLIWIGVAIAWRRRNGVPPVPPARGVVMAGLILAATTVVAGAGRPRTTEVLASAAMVAGLLILGLAIRQALLQLQLWNERLLASRHLPARWKDRRLRALRRLIASSV